MKLPKQYLYELNVHHSSTWRGALLWWLLRKNEDCRHFCPNCEYYFKCQEDVALRNLMEG